MVGIHMLVTFASCLVSLAVALFIVMTKPLHARFTTDSAKGVQKIHKNPTPRIGGLAVICGCIAAGFFMPPEASALYWMILVASLPAVIFGLAEDLTKRVGAGARLLATVAAGVIFCLMTGYSVDHTELALLDIILGWTAVSIAFSAFAIGGAANAFNLIDGVNGLASGSCIIILSGLAIVAWRVGDLEVTYAALALAAALTGFFFVNFPMGKLFLGDAGAYFAGFVVAALTIALVQRHETVSPMLGLLALCYPVTETIVSIQRRMIRQGSHPGRPDRLHLHSLIYRSRAKRLAQFLGVPRMRSALAGLMLMALPLLSTAMMVQFYQSTAIMALCCAVTVFIYLAIYRKAAILRPIMSFSRVPASSRV